MRRALIISIAYLIVGLLWIFLTDWVVFDYLESVSETREAYSNIKGAVFVFLSAVLIFISTYLLFNRYLQSSAEMDMLFSNKEFALIKIDPDGEILNASRNIHEILGYGKSELIGSNIKKIIPGGEFGSGVTTSRYEDRGREMDFFQERAYIHKEGHEVPVRITGTTYHKNSKVRYFIFTIQDISSVRHEEEKFKSIVNDQSELIVRWKPDGIRTFVNDAYCRAYGIEHDKALWSNFRELVPEDDLELLEKRISKLTPRAPINKGTHRFIRSDGEMGWAEWTDRAFFDSKGKVIEYQSVGRDITYLKKRERMYQVLFEESPVAKLVVDRNTLDIINVNGTATRLYGYSKNTFRHLSLNDLRTEHEKNNALIDYAFDNDHQASSLTERHINEKGEFIYAEMNITSIEYLGIDAFLITTLDISQRIRVENLLREEKQYSDSILASLSSHIAVLDSKGEILTVNDAWREYGKANTQTGNIYAEGSNYLDVCERSTLDGDEIAGEVKKGLENVLHRKIEFYSKRYPCHAPHEKRWFLVKAMPLKGSRSGAVVAHENITSEVMAEKRMKEALENLESVVASRTRDLHRAHSQLVEALESTTSSLKYAQRIQKAILPAETELKDAFSQALVYYQPKGLVSGDFYWLTTYQDRIFLACVDCTGHGVPGSLMSMIGNQLLINAIVDRGLIAPDIILKRVHEAIIRLFNKSLNQEDALHDGMDISLCVIEPREQEIHYAGANNAAYLVKDGEWHTLRADRFSLGEVQAGLDREFTVYSHRYHPGDRIYMFSDGYPDQFGGEKGKKFMRKNLLKLFDEIKDVPMKEQESIIARNFEDWRNDQEQVDDVTVVGVELSTRLPEVSDDKTIV